MATILATRGISSTRQLGLGRLISQAVDVWRQRRALATLDAHARRDLGLSYQEVFVETARPIWDLPHQGRF